MEGKDFNLGIMFFGIADIIIGIFGISLSLFFIYFFFNIYSADINRGAGSVARLILPIIYTYFLFILGFLLLIIMGILIRRLKPAAIRFNLYLIPLIAILTYAFFCFVYTTYYSRYGLLEWFIIGLIDSYFISHIFFFTSVEVKQQFRIDINNMGGKIWIREQLQLCYWL